MTPAPWQRVQGEVMMGRTPGNPAGVVNLHDTLGLAHLALPLAAGTGLGRAAGLRGLAPAPGTAYPAFHHQAVLQSPGDFFQGQDHWLPQISPGLRLILALPGASKTEEIFEGLPEGAENILETIKAA